jgi:hypothetical protein
VTHPAAQAPVPVVLLPGLAGASLERSLTGEDVRSPVQLHARLETWQRMFTGQEPQELRTGVVPIDEHRLMLPGTTVRLLQVPYVARPGGLVVPATAVPVPLHLVGVYITAAEIFGLTPSPQVVADQLARMTFTEVLNFVATTLALHRRPGVPVEHTDVEFAEQWLAGPARERVRNLLHDPKRRLVVPQALYVMLKLAALVSPDARLRGVDPGRPPAALFGALGVIDEDGAEGLTDADRVVGTELGPFSSRLLANQHLNKPLDEDHLMARFVRQWLELPTERSGERGVVDLEQAFADATGVPLHDVLVVAVALWARTIEGTPYAPPGYFGELGWDDDRLSAAVRLFSVDPVALRGLLCTEAREKNLAWSVDTLGRYPVVRFEDGGLLVLDRNLLVRRIFGGLLAYDVVAGLSAGGTRTARKRASHVTGCLQHLAEVYALEILEDVAEGGPAAPRVYGDAALQRAFARKGRRIANAAVDYGDAWVVVEVTASKLTRESAAASRDALSKDLDKLVHEAEQIDHTVAALRAEERKLTGARPAPVRRFYPLLVVADGFPVNPFSTELLRQRVKELGLLTGGDVAPLEVVDTIELEMLEGLAEHGGPSMRDVLASKERGVFFRTSMRDFLLVECGLRPRRTQRVSRLMNAAIDPALRELEPPDAA